ncbi:MAG: helix-turn-helix transcriptional regulator [Propylenella sp.]
MTNANTHEPARALSDEERLLPRRLLRKLVPVSDMTIWRWERDGTFPQHLTVHGRNYWLYSEVKDWIGRQRRGAGEGVE